jgi:hypothetical protein
MARFRYVGPMEAAEMFGAIAAPGDEIAVTIPPGYAVSADWEPVDQPKPKPTKKEGD